jgi:membrane protease YdiL (CAAX protease family)
LYLTLNLLVIFVLFPSGALGILSGPTAGLISPTLLANAMMLVVVVGFLRLVGGLSAGDLGLRPTHLTLALGVTFAVWLGVNLLQMTYALGKHISVAVNPDWERLGAPRMLGIFLGQILGNALFEEIMFRGFLFQQMRLRLLRAECRPTTALMVGLGLSQAIFAAIHVPLRLQSGMSLSALPMELALLFVLGVLLALLYWRTGNLFVSVGIHALLNTPLLAVREQMDLGTNGAIAAGASLIVILLWPRYQPAEAFHVTGQAR